MTSEAFGSPPASRRLTRGQPNPPHPESFGTAFHCRPLLFLTERCRAKEFSQDLCSVLPF
jgi:hypothetical protein